MSIIATLNCFLEFTTVRLTPFAVIEPFSMVKVVEVHHVQRCKTSPLVSLNWPIKLASICLERCVHQESPSFIALSKFTWTFSDPVTNVCFF
jgi:hypothetical protein